MQPKILKPFSNQRFVCHRGCKEYNATIKPSQLTKQS
jgi:hypothetical protein